MKIIATNIGSPVTFSWKGREVSTGLFKYPVPSPIFVEKEDVVNDNVIDRQYHGGVDKACYLYAADHYNYWQSLYPKMVMQFGMFGENLTVEGLHEANINIGDIYKIGNAVVQVTQPRQPCFKLEFRFGSSPMIKQFVESGFPGVYVRVLNPGKVNKGDEMILTERKESLSVQKVFELLYAKEFQKEAVEMIVKEPLLAESCRRDLIKRWKIVSDN